MRLSATRAIIFSSLLLFSIQTLARDVVLASDPWQPHYGPDLVNQGYIVEVAREAFARAGHKLKVEFVPWGRAYKLSKRGVYDGLLGAFYTPERTEIFQYTQPIGQSRINLFWNKEDEFQFNRLSELKGLKIGIVKGYHYFDEFNQADYLIKMETYHSAENVDLLLKDRIDMLIGAEEVVDYVLRSRFPESVNRVASLDIPLKVNELYIPISKSVADYQELVEGFNKALAEMKLDGTYIEIIGKHKDEYRP